MNDKRHVRLFRNGRNQALRIPRDLEFAGNEAVLHAEGSRLVIEPVAPTPLLDLLSTLEPVDAPFPDVDDTSPTLDHIRL